MLERFSQVCDWFSHWQNCEDVICLIRQVLCLNSQKITAQLSSLLLLLVVVVVELLLLSFHAFYMFSKEVPSLSAEISGQEVFIAHRTRECHSLDSLNLPRITNAHNLHPSSQETVVNAPTITSMALNFKFLNWISVFVHIILFSLLQLLIRYSYDRYS